MEKGFPISPDRAVFLSDAHLNQDDVHSRTFIALAEKAAAENVALFLLGDIFDLWFGDPNLTFGFQKPVVSRLRELRREGLRLYYVEGNRDFYLKKNHEGHTFDSVAEAEMRAAVGEKRVFLSHGDTVNRADVAYRFWKAISKNRLAFGTVSVLPPTIVLALADRMERKLKRTNKHFRGTFPEKECREFALREFAAGTDFVILGHFHSERLLRFEKDQPTRVLAVLPSWREDWRYFYLTSSGDFGFRAYDAAGPLVP
ncbi:MAG: UDP-2,3-diacylglucosamine diphosphatase [Deltaproteobacteria bacterium]|nr:UDP-2,3-diacylglucosamine diphosphatase [Deltaproteobacteria bacterium]